MLRIVDPGQCRPAARAREPTLEQTPLVCSSFAKVATQADAVAGLFYDRLFALDPGLRRFFPHDLTAQRGKLMAALRTVVGALDRLGEILPAVRELGRRHARCGVEPEHYATAGAALLWALAQVLGTEFTPAVRRAWVDVDTLLAWTMVAAAEVELRDQLAA